VDRLLYNGEAAASYERAMARISQHFVPLMLEAGHLAKGHHLLDVATGTGLIAEAALGVVGPPDTSPPSTSHPTTPAVRSTSRYSTASPAAARRTS